MFDKPRELPSALQSKTEAINWVQTLICDVEERRMLCADHLYDTAGGVRKQQQAWRTFLVHYGNVMGTAGALFRTGWLTEGQYMEVQSGLMNLLLPSVIEAPAEPRAGR